jgi:hypothetical protein
VPGGAFELRDQVGQRRLHADRAQHLDLGGLDHGVAGERGNNGKPRRDGGQRSISHGVLPVFNAQAIRYRLRNLIDEVIHLWRAD